jgi:hypothetical protein
VEADYCIRADCYIAISRNVGSIPSRRTKLLFKTSTRPFEPPPPRLPVQSKTGELFRGLIGRDVKLTDSHLFLRLKMGGTYLYFPYTIIARAMQIYMNH